MRGGVLFQQREKIIKGLSLSLFLFWIYRTPKPSHPRPPDSYHANEPLSIAPIQAFFYTNFPPNACTPLFLALKIQADKIEKKNKTPPITDPGDIKPPSKSQKKRRQPSGLALDLRDIKPGTNQKLSTFGFLQKASKTHGYLEPPLLRSLREQLAVGIKKRVGSAD